MAGEVGFAGGLFTVYITRCRGSDVTVQAPVSAAVRDNGSRDHQTYEAKD